MNWYARFYKDLLNEDGTILYKKNNNRLNTRYEVLDEDKEYYYISNENKNNRNIVSRFHKSLENKLFILKEE